jgi:hypothetical protein
MTFKKIELSTTTPEVYKCIKKRGIKSIMGIKKHR